MLGKKLVAYWASRPGTWGLHIILRSLILMCVSAAPFMAYVVYIEGEDVPVYLSYLLIIGVILAHVGFFIGLVHWLWFTYIKR